MKHLRDYAKYIRYKLCFYERDYITNLLDVKDAFDTAGVPFFLNAGTLLGAWRDGRACFNDLRDIDFSIRNEDLTPEKTNSILERLEGLGFVCPPDRRFENRRQSRFDRFKNHVDIFHYTRVGNYYFRYWSVFGDVPMIVPAHYLDKLDTINFYGRKFCIPSETDNFLTLIMGRDWRHPKSIKDYKSLNDIRLREHAARYEDYQSGRFDEELYLTRGMGWET